MLQPQSWGVLATLDDEVYRISLERGLGVGIRFACVNIAKAKHRLHALIHDLVRGEKL